MDAGDILDRTQLALDAGCDMALICNDQPAMIKVLDSFIYDANPASAMRLARMHGKHTVSRSELQQSDKWHAAVKAVESYADEGTLDLNF